MNEDMPEENIAKFVEPGNVFIPNASGMVFDPLDLPAEEADALLGKPLMDLLREWRDRPPKGLNQYIQYVPVPE